ncbi:uncharacterized protein DS421_12g365450 [Arachis hypogaea]|nr:uncharacterized protein DS421_12g365450 [Arachis hypogaea]
MGTQFLLYPIQVFIWNMPWKVCTFLPSINFNHLGGVFFNSMFPWKLRIS